MPSLSRRASREAALVELQRLHAAIQASRARRGVLVESTPSPTAEALAARELTRRLQIDGEPGPGGRAGRSSRRIWWLAFAAAAIAGGVWAAMTFGRRPPVVATTPVPAAVPPVAAQEPAPPAAEPAAPAHALRVTLDTIRPVWMRVMVDGTRAIEREVPAGEHLVFEGDTRIVVRAGDGGGVRVSFNGEDRGPLGSRDGWPITVPFALEGAGTAPAAPAAPAAPEAPAPTSPPPG